MERMWKSIDWNGSEFFLKDGNFGVHFEQIFFKIMQYLIVFKDLDRSKSDQAQFMSFKVR